MLFVLSMLKKRQETLLKTNFHWQTDDVWSFKIVRFMLVLFLSSGRLTAGRKTLLPRLDNATSFLEK